MSCITISNTETQNKPRIFLTPTKRKRSITETSRNHTHFMNEAESPSIEGIWRWTMTPDAVATCFVKDVFDMRENLLGGADFYWLGRVPCRSVRLVGLVVGVQVYESRILYSIDDGTAVVDCAHRVQRMPKTPSKKPESTGHRAMPVPITGVGHAIRVVGKIHRIHGIRQIQADEIEVCKSANEEPIHWMKVRELHRTNYDLREPFIIPPPSVPVMSDAFKVNELASPSTVMSTPLSSVANSPVKLDPAKLSPPKIRHPSRLRSRDLTDNTFHIYVKHYMIHMPDNDNNDDDDDDFYNEPTMRTSSDVLLTLTTPRATRESGSHRGFTLSYLRRVPELADLARRVVLAEAKRRSREKNGERSRRSTLTERLGPKIKRLFNWAIVKMLQEGCIVLWDGPMRTNVGGGGGGGGAWGMDSAVFSRSCGDVDVPVPDSELISDPGTEEEEGYMPITPVFLGDYVETAIRELVTDPVSKRGRTRGRTGATKEVILRRLHRDDRWRYIGEWQVQDALEYLERERRVWCIGQGWELTL